MGALDGLSPQSRLAGLPLRLLPEEARLAVEELGAAAAVVDDSRLAEEPDDEMRERWKKREEDRAEEREKVRREERIFYPSHFYSAQASRHIQIF